jgi:hypothetical protein
VTATRRPTHVQTLRALSDDRARGHYCLGKAEQARHQYQLGQMQAQDRTAILAGERTSVTDAQGSANWGNTVEARDLMASGVMFGQWADTYLAAYAVKDL